MSLEGNKVSRKRIFVGGTAWWIHEQDVAEIVAKIRAAMENTAVVELTLLDGTDRAVTMYLNGRTVDSVVVDLDLGPRPTEISGA